LLKNLQLQSWCGCIDGGLTKENYINSMELAGFHDIDILSEQPYTDEQKTIGRKITSLIIRAITRE
jgi:hypothetical protein